MLYLKQHLIVCPPFKTHDEELIFQTPRDFMNAQVGILQEQHLLVGPCLSLLRVEKAKKIDPWRNIILKQGSLKRVEVSSIATALFSILYTMVIVLNDSSRTWS